MNHSSSWAAGSVTKVWPHWTPAAELLVALFAPVLALLPVILPVQSGSAGQLLPLAEGLWG